MKFLCILLSVVLTVAVAAGLAWAGNGCCAHCGCQCPCQKMCRLVCEEKSVEVFCWGCKCEDFCVPCPSRPGCKHCEMVCDECPKGDEKICFESKPFVWFDWFPCGAKIYTRTKLMRKTETVKVPSYKWVVEDMCAECSARLEAKPLAEVAELQSDAMPILTR